MDHLITLNRCLVYLACSEDSFTGYLGICRLKITQTIQEFSKGNRNKPQDKLIALVSINFWLSQMQLRYIPH